MLRSVREERSRHFRLALRASIPLLIFIFALAYGVFFREYPIALTTANVVIFLGMLFVVVYFLFFALEESRRETLLDRTTGGYHYESFLERVKKERPRTLAAIQIVNLPALNEAYGVAKTDHVLKQTAEELDAYLFPSHRSHGFIGRKTGAELLIAADTDPEAMEKILEKFRNDHGQIDGLEADYLVAVIRNNIEEPARAIEQLRNMLVQQEALQEEAPAISDARQLSENEQQILEALENGTLSLSFRPLLNLESGGKDIYEVGVRMRGRRGESIPPRDFLPVINRHDLGERYDLLIFKRVLELASLVDETISFSFNLSPFSLRKERFLEEFFRALEASGTSSRRFIVELYERRRHHNLEQYLERLKILRQHGVRLCLDNFGSSNASVEYIRHFPFDMIQFDRDYTRNLEDEKTLSILKSFVGMAHEMEMITAAKWVDNSEKQEKLRSIGVDYIQGYAAGRVLNEQGLLARFNPVRPAPSKHLHHGEDEKK